MSRDAVTAAQWGNLEGLNLAGLTRLSLEKPDEALEGEKAADPAWRPKSGGQIQNRDEQEQDCSDYVTGRGGTYVYTYEEPDTSAWRRQRVRMPDGSVVWRVIRPVFEGALEDLKRGIAPNGERLDGLVVADLDRLTRDNRHLEDAIDVVRYHHRPILDITGTIDLLTDNGRSMARVLVTMNAKSSADTARRVSRKHRAMEQAGIPTGRAPFGWNKDNRTINPEQAQIVREAAERLLARVPASAVVHTWQELGLLTIRGNQWKRASLIEYFRNPRLCGYRGRQVKEMNSYTGGSVSKRYEIVKGRDGKPIVGQWDPILSYEEWESIVAILGDRTTPVRALNTRTYLLTGTLRCGKCGNRIRPFKGYDQAAWRYACAAKVNGGCGGVSVKGAETDQLISAAVLAKFENEAENRDAFSDDAPTAWDREDELLAVADQIRDLTDAWRKQKTISSARYFALLPDLEDEERTLMTERKKWLAASRSAMKVPHDIRQRWDGYSLVEQRAYIQETLSAVVIKPVGRGHRAPIAERLSLVWRED